MWLFGLACATCKISFEHGPTKGVSERYQFWAQIHSRRLSIADHLPMALTRAPARSLLHRATNFCMGFSGAKPPARVAMVATKSNGAVPQWEVHLNSYARLYFEMSKRMAEALRQKEASNIPSTVRDQARDLAFSYGHLSDIANSRKDTIAEKFRRAYIEAKRLSDPQRLKRGPKRYARAWGRLRHAFQACQRSCRPCFRRRRRLRECVKTTRHLSSLFKGGLSSDMFPAQPLKGKGFGKSAETILQVKDHMSSSRRE